MRRNVKHYCSLSKKMVLGASLALIASGSVWATNGNSPSPHADMIQSIMQQKQSKVQSLMKQENQLLVPM